MAPRKRRFAVGHPRGRAKIGVAIVISPRSPRTGFSVFERLFAWTVMGVALAAEAPRERCRRDQGRDHHHEDECRVSSTIDHGLPTDGNAESHVRKNEPDFTPRDHPDANRQTIET